MRSVTGPIWDLWNAGGPFLGDDQAVGRVTVDVDFFLYPAADIGLWTPSKLPVRWFQAAGNPQLEQEVPNVLSINIDRSVDNDAATAEITIANQWMRMNDGTLAVEPEFVLAEATFVDPRSLGEPGFFSPGHGANAEQRARWKQTQTTWFDQLVPNALLRTYQGYGGGSGPIADAVAANRLYLTGLWLVDEVDISTDGKLVMRCRDMAALLVDQQLYPPLIPQGSYPLRYCRWSWREETRSRIVTPAMTTDAGSRPMTYDTSANLAWYDAGIVHGHHPADAFDGDPATFYLSVGNSGPEEPYSVEWVQGNVGALIDEVTVNPYMGNYTCYVSVMVDFAWVDVIGTIPYNEAGIGRYNGVYEARIPAVMRFGVPWESPTTVRLPQAYNAQKVRFTFTNLADSQWGPYPYRAAARELAVGASSASTSAPTTETYSEPVRTDGNYLDFADIVKDLLLWSGWWLATVGPYGGEPAVFGNIESTGSYSEDCLPVDAFDKRPVIDAINLVKEAVGYNFWVDEDGAACFQSPNWWSPGNFTNDGEHHDFIPDVDERVQLTSYGAKLSNKAMRSELIIASADPQAGLAEATVSRFVPSSAPALRGIIRPAMWINKVVTRPDEQRVMAELIAMQLFFQQRIGQVTAWCNPAIQINDQVRVWERQTADSYVHYVRGCSTTWDKESGRYTMTLTTHWLGTPEDWALR